MTAGCRAGSWRRCGGRAERELMGVDYIWRMHVVYSRRWEGELETVVKAKWVGGESLFGRGRSCVAQTKLIPTRAWRSLASAW